MEILLLLAEKIKLLMFMTRETGSYVHGIIYYLVNQYIIKFEFLCSWRCPLKYDIAFLEFSPSNPQLCYVGGLDNEFMCGRHETQNKKTSKGTSEKVPYSQSILQQNHRLGFRGDSRWTGLDVALDSENNDIGIGICESGYAYSICPAQFMVGITQN